MALLLSGIYTPHRNCPAIHKLLLYFFLYQKSALGLKCGFSIPLNVIDEGLSIAHIGPIIINKDTKIGKNCRIHVCVNIGTQAGKVAEAPVIGDNVYIAPGVKMFGKIHIANGIAIGANAVVNKSFTEEGIGIAGVPARKINDKGSVGLI